MKMTLYGDQEAREQLILSCIPIVIDVAKQFSNHSQASYEELFQEGMLGVTEAINKYDYTKNVRFTSFAYYRIIHYIVLWVKRQARYAQTKIEAGYTNGLILNSTVESFRSVFQNNPTDEQLAKLLSIPPDKVAFLRKNYYNPIPGAYRNNSYGNRRLAAVTADASTAVERAMCNEYNRTHILKALESIDEIDREIIKCRYLYTDKKATLEELAEKYQLNASTILRRERRALNSILCYFKENNIEPEF